MTKPCLTLVDASGFIFRSYYALPALTRSDGTPVGAVYGFCTMLLRLLNDYPTTHMAIVFDTARRTFRHDIFPQYKSHRPQVPADLIPQFDLVRQAVRAFHLPVVEEMGYEADDLIATLTKKATAQNWDVTIVSSDKDLMQLIGPQVHMLDTIKNKMIKETDVVEKFGVTPQELRDLLALAGDASDFVPGVPGIGPKTAADLIHTFKTLENLYENIDTIKQKKRRETLENNKDNAFISQKLVTLCDTVPLDDLNTFEKKPFCLQTLSTFLDAQGFKTLVKRLGHEKASIPKVHSVSPQQEVVSKNYHLVLCENELKDLIHRCQAMGYVSIDTETTGLDTMKASLVGISLAFEPHEAYYIPLTHKEGEEINSRQLPKEVVLEAFKPVLLNESILKIGHNIKYDMHIFANEGLTLQGYEDTMVMSYVLFGGQHTHGMDELARLYLNYTTTTFADVMGSLKHKTFDYVDMDAACHYAAEDADVTLQLYNYFKSLLQQKKLAHVYYDIDRPLVAILYDMERQGISVNAATLETLSLDLGHKLEVLQEKIYDLAGQTFNIGSPKQLSQVLFEDMKLASGKKGKSGQHSTGIAVLEDLAAKGHTIAKELIEWRQLSKLKSTYTDALMECIHPTTHRVHTSFALTVTNTGRLSSSHPNLQNIPIRTEEGRKIRDAFQASPDHVLVSLDYSQIELRLLAHMADIASLKQAFHQNEDIHQLTASEVLHVPLSQVTPQQRRDAKAINFGIIYGMSVYGLAAQLGISREEAKTYMTNYAEKYPGILAYMETLKQEARQKGYVTTAWGRRCYTPGIHDKNPALRGFAERQAINAPLQGTAADIMKIAMIKVKNFIKGLDYQVHLLLQVHDELIFDVPKLQADLFMSHIKDIMESAATLTVPLKVDGGCGITWTYAHA